MTEIAPFTGVHYNPTRAGNLGAVICPPYDVIGTEDQKKLYSRSELNFIRVEQAMTSDRDTPDDNKYSRSSSTLSRWLEDGVLQPEPAPAIYIHDHYFRHAQKTLRRRGIIAGVRLEEWNKGHIHPHETTLSRPRSDRMHLMQACRANLSPIWALYEDKGGQTSELLEKLTNGPPVMDMSTPEGERHVVWTITARNAVEQLRVQFARRSLYIADGHHRYETALDYRKQRLAALPMTASAKSEVRDYDLVMMTLVDFRDPGLVILPVHRLINGLAPDIIQNLRQGLEQYFQLHGFPIESLRFLASRELPDLMSDAPVVGSRTAGPSEPKMGVVGLQRGRFFLLTWNADLERAVAAHHSRPSAKLATGVFHHTVIENILKCNGVEDGGLIIDYTYDAQRATEKVLNQEWQLAFLLQPVHASMIKAVGDAGDRMPGKTTYFHPKLPSGLVLRLLKD